MMIHIKKHCTDSKVYVDANDWDNLNRGTKVKNLIYVIQNLDEDKLKDIMLNIYKYNTKIEHYEASDCERCGNNSEYYEITIK